MTIMQDTPTTGTSGTQSPILNIDGPQATLLLWGGFTSWAWQTWTPDTPHYSVIIKMVGGSTTNQGTALEMTRA